MLTIVPTLAELPFRGDRNYLHSTDLFPALSEYAQRHFSPTAFIENLILRRTIHHQVRIHFDEPEDAFGSFSVRNGMQRTKGWLVETNESVRRHIRFDEAAALQSM